MSKKLSPPTPLNLNLTNAEITLLEAHGPYIDSEDRDAALADIIANRKDGKPSTPTKQLFTRSQKEYLRDGILNPLQLIKYLIEKANELDPETEFIDELMLVQAGASLQQLEEFMEQL